MELAKVMQRLYDSEINCGMQGMYAKGFTVWLGDEVNGIDALQSFTGEQLQYAAKWLHEQACVHYPNSAYAQSSANR
jgi:hypothetical protein